MRRSLLYSIILLLPVVCTAQDAKIRVLPFIFATTSVKEGQIEAGPEINLEDAGKGYTFTMRPLIRMPLTGRADNILQIDRFTSTWKSLLTMQFTRDFTGESGVIRRHSVNGQVEFGSAGYKYYPTGNSSVEEKTTKSSYSFELKYIGFYSKGVPGALQLSPQFRLRYSYDWRAAGAVGIVNPPNSEGLVTVTNMIIEAPGVYPSFSPAFSLQFYPGSGNFSYSPALYLDLTGRKGDNNPFNNLNRLRMEGWIFFYPLIDNNPNVKIGVTPFLSIRMAGSDGFNSIEYGGMISLKFGTTFLQFL